ncbi:MAG TPA: hypothetical protein VJZ49_09455 [Syntrophales bacterium]|nr:hypothetical protein [Syntrophales bacterium]
MATNCGSSADDVGRDVSWRPSYREIDPFSAIFDIDIRDMER